SDEILPRARVTRQRSPERHCDTPSGPSVSMPRERNRERRSFMPLTQSQLVGEVADRAGLSKSDTKSVLDALEEVVLDQLAEAEKVKIGGVVQLTVRVKDATKARKGRNPATGEEITIGPKPASVTVKARPLAKAKAALPSVAAARARLAA